MGYSGNSRWLCDLSRAYPWGVTSTSKKLQWLEQREKPRIEGLHDNLSMLGGQVPWGNPTA